MLSRIKNVCLFVLFFIIGNVSLAAFAVEFIKAGPPFINSETIADEKVANVSAILHDSQGYIWLVNESGLLRYDGNEFKIFPGLEQFTSPDVEQIVEGQSGRLWIATSDKGLALFDTKTAQLRFLDPAEMFALDPTIASKGDKIHGLIYKNNRLYFAIKNQILIIDETSLTLQQQVSIPLDENDIIIRLMLSSNGDIWGSSYHGNGAFVFNNEGLHYYEHKLSDTTTLSAKLVVNIFEDSQHRIWFGTYNGLDLFLPDTGKFIRYTPRDRSLDKNKNLGTIANLVSGITEDAEGNLLLGLYHGGVFKFQPELEVFEHYQSVTGVDSTILSNALTLHPNVVFTDRQKTLWALTQKGIGKLPLKNRNINQWANIEKDKCLPNAMHQGNAAIFFACNNALYQFKNNKISHVENFTKRIFSIFQQQDSNIWLGTNGGGIFRYNVITKSKKHYGFTSKVNSDLSVNMVQHLREDINGDLYGIAGQHTQKNGSGILRYNQAKNEFSNLGAEYQYSDFIDIDKTKMLFIRGQTKQLNNLYWFNKNSELMQQLPIATGDVYAAIKWQQKLWLSTENLGLIRVDIDTEKWHEITVQGIDKVDGLYLHAATDKLYLSRKSQLYKLSPVSNDKVIVHCITCSGTLNLPRINHEQFGQLYITNGLLTRAGDFLIRTTNRLLAFPLEQGDISNTSSRVLLTDYKVMGKSVIPEENNKHALLTQSIELTKKITIPPETTFISFNFARLGALQPKKVKFAYKLEGLNKNWIYTDSKRAEAIFSLLAPGNYTFKVKASDETGHWHVNEQPTALEIIVLPAWWQTWWAYSIYLGCILALFSLFYRVRLADKSRQSALEMASTKEQLFANISHEFRTPLTLILGPVNVIRSDSDKVNISDNLDLIERNAHRLLTMVDQLLHLAQLKEQQKQSSTSQQVSVICHGMMQSFNLMACDKAITLTLDSVIDDDWWVTGSQDTLETILGNLLTNAIKYTKEKGQISLAISEQGSWIEFKLTDTGCGIAANEREKIFERFTRLENSQNSVPGAGIGLALVKELVNSLTGKITVESQLGLGSTFVFTLPKVNPSTQTPNNNSNTEAGKPVMLAMPVESKPHQQANITASAEDDRPSQDVVKLTLLIVEDNVEMREFIKGRLIGDYHIIEASDGFQGLALALEYSPDIIVSDVMMPNMDGFQLLRAIRAEMAISHIPVILLTAKNDQQSKLKGLSDLADDYIAKPFDSQELLLRIKNLLGIRAILQNRFDQSCLQPELNSLPDSSPPDNNHTVTNDRLSVKEQQFLVRFKMSLGKKYPLAELSLTMIAGDLAMSERQLQRKLKAITGINFSELVRDYRLTQGCLLLNEGLQVAVIAEQVGFSSSSYFVRCFKAKYDKTPNEYRKTS